MDEEEDSSLHPSRAPHFFRIILSHTLENGTLEIPRRFVKKHGNYLSKYVSLEVSTGAMWKVKLRRGEGRLWLHKGWQDFAEYDSVKYGYFLVFRYEGGSFFHVFIFDTTALEIEYAVNGTSTTRRVKLEQSKVSKIKEEDNEDDDHVSVEILDESSRKLHKSRKVEDNDVDVCFEIPNEWPRKLHKSREVPLANQSRNLRTRQYSSSTKNNLHGDDQVIEEGIGLNATSARDKVLQRAKAFRSPNPHFIICMQPTYVSDRAYLHIPESHARRYFLKKGKDVIYLKGADGRSWFVKYFVAVGPYNQVRLSSGWTKFARENHLEAGDACVFELVNRASMAYKVTIFRIADEEEIDKKASLKTSTHIAPLPCMKKSAKEAKRAAYANKGIQRAAGSKRGVNHDASNAQDKVLKRAKTFKSKHPHFIIHMSPGYVSCKSCVYVPVPHSRRYLKGNKLRENVIILHGSNGRTWEILYHFFSSSPRRARLGHGWKDFVSDNHLQVGDVCIFEMISGKAKAYKVTILHIAHYA